MNDDFEEEDIDLRPAEPIRPVTAIPWSGWKEKVKPTKSQKKLPLSTRKFIEWERKRYLREQLPKVFHTAIMQLDRPDLLTAASLFKAYRVEDFRSEPKSALIQFILAHREDPEQYYPAEPMPYGALPDLG